MACWFPPPTWVDVDGPTARAPSPSRRATAGHRISVPADQRYRRSSPVREPDTGPLVQGDAPADTTDPSLSGTARDGETLTLDDGDWTGTPTIVPTATSGSAATRRQQLRRHRRRDRPDLRAAAAPTSASTVRAVVTVTNACGNASEATDAERRRDSPRRPPSRSHPTVIGTAIDGQTVTRRPRRLDRHAPVTFDVPVAALRPRRHELRRRSPAPRTTSYTLTSADAGHGIRVEVTATNAAGSATGTSPVAAVDAAAPQNTALPTVSGTPRRRPHADRRRRHLDRHDADRPTTTSGCAATPTAPTASRIPGATGSTYTLDRRRRRPRRSASRHRVQRRRLATRPPRAPPAAPSAPTRRRQRTLAGRHRHAAGRPDADRRRPAAGPAPTPLDYTYQWQRCDAAGTDCADIAGATDPTYTLTPHDVGATVRVVVTATNAAGDDTARSAPTATVDAAPPVNTTSRRRHRQRPSTARR